ncbi:MAG: hypothetical protein ACREKE_03340, partial [bacterium]
ARVVDLWSVSPKWDGRRVGAAARTRAMDYDEAALAEYARRFAADRLQLKFVVTFAGLQPRSGDLDRVVELLLGLPAAQSAPVFLIPEAYAAGDYRERCRALERAAGSLFRGPLAGWDLRVQPQWHRVLYGDERGR